MISLPKDRLVAIVLVLGVTWPLCADGQAWPGWRGFEEGVAATNGRLAIAPGESLRLVWKKPLGPAYSSVSVAAGRAVTLFSDGEADFVVALDAARGHELWRYRIDDTYFGHDGSHDGPLSTPLLHGGKVFVLSPRGRLLALDAERGHLIWSHDLVADLGAKKPFYGFTSSPAGHDRVVIVATGIRPDRAFTGFDRDTGEVLWSSGSAWIEYQSPIVADFAGRRQVIIGGGRSLYGLDPETGEELWKLEHQGNWVNTNPVVIDHNTLFVDHKQDEGLVLRVDAAGDAFRAEEKVRTNAFKSYSTPVYHEGHIYGYRGSFLTAIDAASGEKVWKSRPPGDGFLILVDGKLVILTRKGTLHLAAASSHGYEELAHLSVFDDICWTPPSFTDGRIYVRGMSEIAAVEVGRAATAAAVAEPRPGLAPPGSKLAAFLREVEKAGDKKAAIDAFMTAQKSFPVIEGRNLAHVIYRGHAEDIALTGDIFKGAVGYAMREEQPLHRVAGTDFFYYSLALESDARVEYQLVRGFETETDALNPSRNGAKSVLTMPDFEVTAYPSEADDPLRGRLETMELLSERLAKPSQLQVYLPPGYDGDGSERYPVLYLHDKPADLKTGRIVTTLDRLIGEERVAPFVAVLIHVESWRRVLWKKEDHLTVFVDELVPHVEKSYRVAADPRQRAVLGTGLGGYYSLYAALARPGTFGKVGVRSAFLQPEGTAALEILIAASEDASTSFHLSWGKYDLRTGEGNLDIPGDHRHLAELLREKNFVGHFEQYNEGWGWGSWLHRIGGVLEFLFPRR